MTPATRTSHRTPLPDRVLLTALLWLTAAAYLTPLLFMLTSSFKTADGVLDPSASVLPRFSDTVQAIDNYRAVWTDSATDFPTYLRNSLLVAMLSTIGMTLSSAAAAYAFARMRFRGRTALFVLVLATLMIPSTVIIAPQYLLFKQLGWIGTFRPLWVPAFCGGAFSIFLLRQFFLTIPRELDEAAAIDGCSSFGVFCRVILPVARPALVVVALLQFIGSWNDFVGPLVFINQPHMYTVSLGVYMFQSQQGQTPWNLTMAASVMAVVPVLLVFLLAQKAIIEGVATQGLKE
jgi:multiple sugar transport system permease protein